MSTLNYSSEQTPPGDPGPRRAPRTLWVIWIAIFGGIILLMVFRDHVDSQSEYLPEYSFLQKVDSNLIAQAVIRFNPQGSALTEITGRYYRADNEGKKLADGSTVPFHTKARLTEAMEEKLLSLPQFEPSEPNTMLMNVLWSLLPIVLIAALIWFFFIRQIRKASKQSGTIEQRNNRMDKILDKWEEQARRMDAILDKMEREK